MFLTSDCIVKTSFRKMNSQDTIKIALVDDHHMVIEGLQKVLSTIPNLHITGVYNRASAFLQSITKDPPDVVLLDVQLPDQTGLELTKKITKDFPAIRILALSGVESSYYVMDMIKHGCYGYLFKSTATRELLGQAIEHVYKEEIFLDPSIKQDVLQQMIQNKRKKEKIVPRLTEREKEVLKLIVKEYSNQEIADHLFISLRTVENHRHHLFQKLDVKSAVGLTKVALQMGLCD